MPVELIKPSFAAGELAPSFWGRLDNPMWHRGASVMRNMFVNYRGPASSRAGLAFVGQCRQRASASSTPPRIITFRFNIFQNYILEFGDFYMRVISNGAYVTETPVAITNITQANPAVVSAAGHNFINGDWVAIGSVAGMTRVDGRSFIVANAVAGATFSLVDTFGIPVDSRAFAAYAGGGTAARILTVASPYAAADLPYLKVKQNANLMSLTCINQQTGAEYPATDLTRLAANNWAFSTTSFASSIAPPATCTAVATVNPSGSELPTTYSFVVTAIDAVTGDESQPSPVGTATNSVDIATTSGSLVVTWAPVVGAAYYQIYQAPPAVSTTVPIGSSFGFIGRAYGTQFVNSNIVPDFAQTPPAHVNPFARGQIQGVGAVPGNANFNQATTTATVTSVNGTGAAIVPVAVPPVTGVVQTGIVQNPGQNYQPGDTVTFTDSATAATVTAPLVIGPQTGTYPGVVSYFQQRRYYAMTINEADTQFLSQTGAYTDFDTATPPVDDDAIISTPWGEQINAIQWAIPMPGGLLVGTGLGAWQVSGTGGAGSVMTPAQQAAIAQESYGFSPTVAPIKVNYSILYVPSLTASVREQQYNFWNNIYASVELSVYSNHLFENRGIVSWAWARDPNKLIWITRDDGKFLSLTYLKEGEQPVIGFARHDTNGIVAWNEVATEPPVDAAYFVVKRFIVGQNQWAYYIERMDNRLWESAEDTLCMDAALALPNPTPNATLWAAAAQGPGIPTGGFLASGGNGYTAPSATLFDPTGQGSGCVINLIFTPNGPITNFAMVGGQNYSPASQVVIIDPTGNGAVIVPIISQNVTFNASAPVFGATQVGDVIRGGGGQATVSQVLNNTQVVAAITIPILQTIPNDPNNLPLPFAPGKWSITTPVQAVQNLDHLEGMQVCVLADGAVIAGGDEPLLTVVNGSIALPAPASSIKVGLPFTAQLQAMHTDVQGAPTVQGKKQNIMGTVLRVEKSRGIKVGGNQPVASTLPYRPEIPWTNMHPVPDRASVNVPAAALPLFTGDSTRVPVGSGPYNWNGAEPAPGMVAVQQSNPLPMNILAIMPDVDVAEPNTQ